jgi:hypothetical protein
MFPRAALTVLALFGLLAMSTSADAGVVQVGSQLQSTLLCHSVGQPAYIWSVELYANCPVHGSTLYGRYFVTCDYYGNYLNYGGIDYACNDIIASGRTPVIANQVFWRETYDW